MWFEQFKNTFLKGAHGESLASEYLRKLGYCEKARNYRYGRAEIDLIMEKDGILSFIEVKMEKEDTPYPSDLKVNEGKRKRIVKTALKFMNEYSDDERTYRFDIMRVQESGSKYAFHFIENAFDDQGIRNIF